MQPNEPAPVFRFAPSPNGALHLGHALSALLNWDMARQTGGRFLLRIENLDSARSRPQFEQAIYDDLTWLGLDWEEPVRRQSDHVATYQRALDELKERGLVYPAFLSRGEIKAFQRQALEKGEAWPVDPEGAPLYPDLDRLLSNEERRNLLGARRRHGDRLDMAKAIVSIQQELSWQEEGQGLPARVTADPGAWGDVTLWRLDAPASYHLAVVLDDALQGITHVVRGMDLYRATSVHVLLQRLLGLPQPVYHHHRLILGPDGRKLSKSLGSTAINVLREQGVSPSEIRQLAGLG